MNAILCYLRFHYILYVCAYESIALNPYLDIAIESCCDWPATCSMVRDSSNSTVILLQPPDCQSHRCAPPSLGPQVLFLSSVYTVQKSAHLWQNKSIQSQTIQLVPVHLRAALGRRASRVRLIFLCFSPSFLPCIFSSFILFPCWGMKSRATCTLSFRCTMELVFSAS